MSDVDVVTAAGGRLTSIEALGAYNREQVARTVAEGLQRRREAPDRAEKVITDAIEGEGRSYLDSVAKGRTYFFGMGFDAKGKRI